MALITCSECGKEISNKASACPGCGAPVSVGQQSVATQPAPTQNFAQGSTSILDTYEKPKKPFYKRVWFIVLASFVGLFVLVGILGEDKSDTDDSKSQETSSTAPADDNQSQGALTSQAPSVEPDAEPSAEPSVEPSVEPAPSTGATIGQKNALASAKSYLSLMSFSYTGLIKQLEYEKYPHEDAVYAADNCGANWNEQAAKSAASYLESMPFSRDGLIKQLEYEGYTHEQALYGVEANGY